MEVNRNEICEHTGTMRKRYQTGLKSCILGLTPVWQGVKMYGKEGIYDPNARNRAARYSEIQWMGYDQKEKIPSKVSVCYAAPREESPGGLYHARVTPRAVDSRASAQQNQKIKSGLSQPTIENSVAVLLVPTCFGEPRNKHGTRYQQYAYVNYRQVAKHLSRLCNSPHLHRRAG